MDNLWFFDRKKTALKTKITSIGIAANINAKNIKGAINNVKLIKHNIGNKSQKVCSLAQILKPLCIKVNRHKLAILAVKAVTEPG